MLGLENLLAIPWWHRAAACRGKGTEYFFLDRGHSSKRAEAILAADTLLTLLLEDTRNVAARMAAVGFSEDEVRGAWNYARQAGHTEATLLGADKLTEAGKARAQQLM